MILTVTIVVLCIVSVIAGWFVFAAEAEGRPKSIAFAVFVVALIALVTALVVGYFRLTFVD